MEFREVVSRIAHESLAQAPRIMPGNPWWNRLESNFHQRPEGFELGFLDQLRVGGTAAFDIAMRTLASSALLATALPVGYHPLNLRAMVKEAPLYTELADAGDPSAFFKRPPRGVPIQRRAARWPHFRPKGGIAEDLRFVSPFEPVHPELRKRFGRSRKNRLAHARYWHHHDGPRPTIVAIHGFGADPYWLNERLFALKWFFHQMRCNVLLYTLPFHGQRQPVLSPFSGHGFFAGGISMINEAMAQAVYDFRIFFDYLQHELGVEKIGVTGISLGGYTSAILAVAEPRLYFSIPNVPLASLADLILEWWPISGAVRTFLSATRRSVKDLRHMLGVHSPLTYRPVIPRERLMIIGGVGDRLAPPKHSRLLWDHWDRCPIHWYPGSHLVHLDRGTYLRQMAKFMASIGFVEKRAKS